MSFSGRGKIEVGLSGVSANWRSGLFDFDSTYSEKPIAKNNGISRKRAKPEYLLKHNVIKKIPKQEIKRVRSTNNYSVTKVKARNLLTNVLYNRVKETDFQNRSFVIDCYSFIILYLNPFYLETMLMQCGI